jgi:predicted phosphohydrolase
MRIFAIADLHLSKAQPKPMDVFGGNWQGHPQIIFERWQESIQKDDLVLIPGDISWAMNLDEALEDLKDVAALPGKKVLLRGNHDYWWSAIGKLRQSLPKDMYALQNDALVFDDVVIAGARGWNCPGSYDFSEQDLKIYQREVSRLKLSLEAARAYPDKKLIVMMHFPPTNPKLEPSGFTELLLKAKPSALVFGHIHGENQMMPLPNLGETKVHFVAADALEFYPKRIL